MRCLILLACGLAVATAQTSNGIFDAFKDFFNDNTDDYTIDYVENYRIEDHDTQTGPHVLIAISDTRADSTCHLIEIAPRWEPLLQDPTKLHQITADIYHQIITHTGQETHLDYFDLLNKYGDGDALKECYQHTVYEMVYTPTAGTFTTTTAPPR